MKIIRTNANIKTRLLIATVLAFIGTILSPALSQSAYAVAPGCSSGRPTAITGTVTGYGGDYHSWSVNVLVGMDLSNSAGQKLKPDGSSISGGTYSYTDAVNPNLAPPGAPSGQDRTFGASLADGNGVLCVASSITKAWFELYPKNTSGVTQKTYFGGANDQQMPVKPGTTNTYGLRLPTAHDHGGNTGDVNGYVSYQQHSVNPSNLKFRAFPYQGGTACGVQGFSAGADSVGVSSGAGATYYLIKNLAGGQCGASTQPYKISVSCTSVCGASSRTITYIVEVANGARPRKDFKF